MQEHSPRCGQMSGCSSCCACPRLQTAMRDHFAACRFASYDGTRPAWVFHHTTTRRQYRAGDRIKSLRGAFGNAVARAKLPDELRQHDLRHRRVTTWLAEGKSAALVQEAMGSLRHSGDAGLFTSGARAPQGASRL
jgi:hypothetical protein